MKTQTSKPRPVISWPGGKTRLLKHLLSRIPEHTLYVEVFGGGLAMFLAKERSPAEVINDINGDLVSFYRNCQFHYETILDQIDYVLNSRREFEDYLCQPGLTEIQRAARWFIRNKLSFGGQGEHFAITRTQPLGSRAQRMVAIRELSYRLDRTVVVHLDWTKLFDRYDAPATFFFLDPPYLDAGGAAYAGWSEADLERFCTRLAALKGRWLLTYQDCAQVRELMRGRPIKSVDRANGIGNHGRQRAGRRYQEVIISDR